jgi:phosphotransferase system HPr (HPr) family protein
MRISKTLVFPFDLQGRAASSLIKEVTNEILDPVFLSKDNREVNLNSLLGVLSLGIKKGDRIALSSYSEETLNNCIDIIKKEEKDYGTNLN